MKKKLLLASVVAMLLPCMAGCDTEEERTDIRSITFIDYLVKEQIQKIDFDSNSYSYIESEEISLDNEGTKGKEIKYSINSTFSEEAEAKFLEDFKKTGVSKLQSVYGDTTKELENYFQIEYTNGETFISKGYGVDGLISFLNEDATDIYSRLGKCCYDLIGECIFLGWDMEYPFKEKFDYHPIIYNSIGGEYGIFTNKHYFPMEGGNYKWEDKTKNDADIYELNLKHKNNICVEDGDYYLSLDSIWYYANNDDCNVKEFVLTSYDFCKELTNKKIDVDFKFNTSSSDEFFNDAYFAFQHKLELNKIYTVDYIYGDGDYYQYTFNTFTNGKKIPYGRYYSPSKSYYYFGCLDIQSDNTFTYHFVQNNSIYHCDETYDVSGTYEFKTFDDKEKLVLNMGNDEVLVYDFNHEFLIADSANSTYKKNRYAKEIYDLTEELWGEEATLKYVPLEIL